MRVHQVTGVPTELDVLLRYAPELRFGTVLS